MSLATCSDQLVEMKVDGLPCLVDIQSQNDDLIEGIVDGFPVTLHRIGQEWFIEVDGHPAPNTIGVEGAIPDAVFRAIAERLDADHGLTWDRVMTQALSMWVLQQGHSDRAVNRAYLDATFLEAAAA